MLNVILFLFHLLVPHAGTDTALHELSAAAFATSRDNHAECAFVADHGAFSGIPDEAEGLHVKCPSLRIIVSRPESQESVLYTPLLSTASTRSLCSVNDLWIPPGSSSFRPTIYLAQGKLVI